MGKFFTTLYFFIFNIRVIGHAVLIFKKGGGGSATCKPIKNEKK